MRTKSPKRVAKVPHTFRISDRELQLLRQEAHGDRSIRSMNAALEQAVRFWLLARRELQAAEAR